MNNVYMLKCLRIKRTLGGDFLDAEEITTGIYATFELAEEDGEKFIEEGQFEAYTISSWRVIDEHTLIPKLCSINQVKGCYDSIN